MTDPNDAEAPQDQPLQQTTQFQERAVLRGHNQAITSLQVNSEHILLVSGSRDRTALIWRLSRTQENWGIPYTRLVGHSHFVSGVSFSSDSTHLLTSSWDKTIRLWDLQTRTTKKLFLDHKKDVLAVTFSPDNRRIISCGRDKLVKLWNILGECKVSLTEGGAWATSIACAPTAEEGGPLKIAVGYWDGHVKIQSIGETMEELFSLEAHTGRVAAIAFTPDGQWLVTGGSDRKVALWTVATGGATCRFSAPAPVNAVAASPTRTWVCAATYEGIAIWDIQEQAQIDLVVPLWPRLAVKPDKVQKGRNPDCTALAWAEDGSALYAGYNNGEIRVWEVRASE